MNRHVSIDKKADSGGHRARLRKRLLDAALPLTPGATLETQAGALCGSTEDAREGRTSFLERRPPRYQGR